MSDLSFLRSTGDHNRSLPYNGRMPDSKLVVVQAFASQVEADLATAALESAGIDAMIQADRAGGMRDHLAWSGMGFKVVVRDEDAATARALLRPPQPNELVLIRTFATETEAETAQGALMSVGISATIQDDSATGWRPGAAWNGTGFRVLVPEQDAAAAREVLEPTSGTHS